jgi:hypothetical protein
MRYRDGVLGPVEFFPSSSALGADSLVATTVGIVTPGYAHNIVLNDQPDQSALGWQPVRVVLSDMAFVNTQVEFFLKGANSDTFKRWSLVQDHVGTGVSVGTFVLPRLPMVGRPTSVELGVFRLPDSMPARLIERGQWAGRLSTRLVLDKLQLTVLVNRRIRSISFGVSDLNGVAYWIFR